MAAHQWYRPKPAFSLGCLRYILLEMDADAYLASVVGQYAEHGNPSLARLMNFAGFGVEMSAQGCTIVDHEGREFLDFLGGYGVFSLGHRHPKVIEAVKKQLDLMPLSSKVFFSPRQAELATKLASIAPEGLQYTFFSNSGAEAVECALKFARMTTGKTGFLATHGGYHGKTLGALSVTGREKYRKPVEPLIPGAVFAPFGDLGAARAAMTHEVAAIIVEVVQGEGGIHIAPSGYLNGLRQLCDEFGALLIIDEVQTGLGRTGTMFACEAEGVRPDMMTLAKCLGGGVMPIGATMGTERVWEAVYGVNPLMHTSTFGGNPLACAAGLAALEVIQSEGLVERSRQLGDYLLQRLSRVQSELIADIRGPGLMVGVEFAMDEVGELVIAQMTKRGVIAAYTLNNPRVIRLEPPLVVTEPQIDQAVDVLAGAIEETEELLAQVV